MINRSILAAFLMLTLGPMSALGSDPTPAAKTVYYVEDPVKWAKPIQVVPPVHPPALLAAGVTGTVEAVLNLKDSGLVESVISLSSEPKSAEFEAAVREVIQHWEFAQSFGPDCKPVATQSKVMVWFELKDGKSSLSVSGMPVAAPANSASIKALNSEEVSRRLAELYPRPAVRDRSEANVHTRLLVEPTTGLVKEVEIMAVTAAARLFRPEVRGGQLRSANRPPPVAAQFAYAAKEGLSIYRFEVPPNAGADPITVCRHVAFFIKD